MNPAYSKAAALVVAGVLIGTVVVLHDASSGCVPLRQSNPLVIDQSEIPDSLDPGVTFSTPGWAIVQQVYQGLVQYNDSNATSFVGVLAQGNWTESSDGLHWVFTIRPGVHFSNGDPYNAYVQWYSFYRSLLLESGPQFILEQNFYSTNFNPIDPLNYSSNLTNISYANASLAQDLNSWNFDAPNASEIKSMSYPNQSFRVLGLDTIELNVGYGYLGPHPYGYLLASISAPNSYAVDPRVVDAHGGVVIGQVNDWLATNMVGTGPYVLSYYEGLPGAGYTLTPDSNYWGRLAAAGAPENDPLQPAKSTIEVNFEDSVDITTNDLEKGYVATASFAYIGPSTVHLLAGQSCLSVKFLKTIYGSTSGSWWIYLNQDTFPFDNLSVREAIAHAINYPQIIDQAFGGYATQWVGPVPPAYPYSNPAGLAPYAYDLTLARAEIADSPCADGGCSAPIKYAYLDSGTDWFETAQFLAADLKAIGLTIIPTPISLDELYSEQVPNSAGVCTTLTSTNGGPFPMGQEFYTSDYISPDDWTQNDAISYGSANACMSAYNNSVVDNLTLQGARSSSNTTLTEIYTNITAAMYSNYTDIWLVVPTSVTVVSTALQGFVQNPMGSAEPFVITVNTMYAT